MVSSKGGHFAVDVHVTHLDFGVDHHRRMEHGDSGPVGTPNRLLRRGHGASGVEIRYPIRGTFSGGAPHVSGPTVEPFDYEVTVDLDATGRLAVTRLEIMSRPGGPGLTTARLR